MRLTVDRDGSVRCVYGEAIDLSLLGPLGVRRAGRVEPDRRGRWWADLSPLHGPKLGPYRLRSQALAAEAAWVERFLSRPAGTP